MKKTFRTNLGTEDAAKCNQQCGCNLNVAECKAGNEVDVPPKAIDWLTSRYPGMFEEEVAGVSAAPKIQGVPHK